MANNTATVKDLSLPGANKGGESVLKATNRCAKKVQGIRKELSPKIIVELVELIHWEVKITKACAWLGVPRATYHRWRAKNETRPLDSMVEEIRELCSENNFRYGYRKITTLLRKKYKINHKRVQRIMQCEQLQCRVRVKKRKHTGQPAYVAEYLLKRKFQAEAPMHKLVTDITYLPFGRKMIYLSSILDLYNGEIVASSLSDTQDKAFVLDTLNQLPAVPGAILHSDQGSVYTSLGIRKL